MSEAMDEHVSDGLEKVLSAISSQVFELNSLKFLTQSVVPSGQLDSCEGVFEVYRKMRDSRALKSENHDVIVSFLRHILVVSGYNREKELNDLDAYCCKEEIDLTKFAPSLLSYELLFQLANKLLENKSNRRLVESIDQEKLNESKLNFYSLHPVCLFKSMIGNAALDPNDPTSLEKDLVTILSVDGLNRELEFVQSSFQHSSDGSDEVIGVTTFYGYKGQPLSSNQQRISHYIPAMEVWQETQDNGERETLIMNQDPSTTESVRQYSSMSPKCKVCCIGSFLSCIGLIVLFAIGVVVAFKIATQAALSHPNHTQHVYGYNPIVYSPFPEVNLFYYDSIKGTICEDQSPSSQNVTICATLCPLKNTPSHSWVNGTCPKGRFISNCYFNVFGYQVPGINAQSFSRYMLTKSKVTFTIAIDGPSQANAVQLCITTNKDACGHIFNNNSTNSATCQYVLTFNEVNGYTSTFRAPRDSYYCAIWLLNKNQWIDYTANVTLLSYQIPPSNCKNYSKEFTADLRALSHQTERNSITTQEQNVCVLVQENGMIRYNHDIIIFMSLIIHPVVHNLAFILGLIAMLCLLIVVVIIVIKAIYFIRRFRHHRCPFRNR